MGNPISDALLGLSGNAGTNIAPQAATPFLPAMLPNSPLRTNASGNAATPGAAAPLSLFQRASNFLASPQGKSLFASLGQVGSAIATPGSFQDRLGKVGSNLNTGGLVAQALSNSASGIDINAILKAFAGGSANIPAANSNQ